MHIQDGRKLTLFVWNIGIGCHPDTGPRLKDQLFDAISFAREFAQDSRFQRTGLFGESAPRRCQFCFQCRTAMFPLIFRFWSRVILSKCFGLLFHERIELQRRHHSVIGTGHRHKSDQAQRGRHGITKTHGHSPDSCDRERLQSGETYCTTTRSTVAAWETTDTETGRVPVDGGVTRCIRFETISTVREVP